MAGLHKCRRIADSRDPVMASKTSQKIFPFLWYAKEAEEAARPGGEVAMELRAIRGDPHLEPIERLMRSGKRQRITQRRATSWCDHVVQGHLDDEVERYMGEKWALVRRRPPAALAWANRIDKSLWRGGGPDDIHRVRRSHRDLVSGWLPSRPRHSFVRCRGWRHEPSACVRRLPCGA